MAPQKYKNVVTFDDDATDGLLRGAEIVYRAVSSTLGPKSRLVAIKAPFSNPTTVGDGVTVAKAVVQYGLEDESEDTGAKLLTLAAVATNDMVGDGTTTTTILAYEIVKAAHEAIKNGANAAMLSRGIDRAVNDVCKYLDSIKTEIIDAQIKQVATVSAQDGKLGEMIGNAFERLGKNGVVTVEESTGTETTLEFKEGMEFDKGYLSNYFVTTPESNEATVVKPYILVTDHKLDSNEQLVGFLENFVSGVQPDERNIVIICDGAEPMCLATCVAQKLKGVMNILVIQAPGNQDHKVDLLKDVAVSTGATFISKEAKMPLKNVTVKELGQADHVTASDKSTVIVDGKAVEEDLLARVQLLTERRYNSDTSAFDREKLTERLAKLTSGLGIITVGGNNEAEISEMRERAIDAVEATKAALEDGVVAGGETALLRASNIENYERPSEQYFEGYSIVLEACKAPFFKLLENSHIEGDINFKIDSDAHGIDVISGKQINLIDVGIIDPVKVPKTAIRQAAKAASQLLRTNTIIGTKETYTAKE